MENTLAEESKKIQKLREKLKQQLNQIEQKVAKRTLKNKTVIMQGKEARISCSRF